MPRFPYTSPPNSARITTSPITVPIPCSSSKRTISKNRKKKIPKVVGVFTALMMEQAFFKPLGFDNEKEIWTIVGDGDVPVSVTSNTDVGKFTTEAAIMAFQEPDKIPEHLVISSCTMTFQE